MMKKATEKVENDPDKKNIIKYIYNKMQSPMCDVKTAKDVNMANVKTFLDSYGNELKNINGQLNKQINRTDNNNILYYIYYRIAKIIENALTTLGFNSCVYIIDNFPKGVRDQVYNLLKKEIEFRSKHYE